MVIKTRFEIAEAADQTDGQMYVLKVYPKNPRDLRELAHQGPSVRAVTLTDLLFEIAWRETTESTEFEAAILGALCNTRAKTTVEELRAKLLEEDL